MISKLKKEAEEAEQKRNFAKIERQKFKSKKGNVGKKFANA